jgi:hypothetical protein
MKTDVELIEAAAKAAGIKHAMYWEGAPEGGEPYAYASLAKGIYWRPLGDDGDALRLVVALDIGLRPDAYGARKEPGVYANARIAGAEPGRQVIHIDVPHGSDKPAAVRRAIVLVAAAVWEEQQRVGG